MFPQAVFLDRGERKALNNLCTLGWSLVLLHIEIFLSQMASFQGVKEEGANCCLVLGTSGCCLPTILRGCQICWAFRSMPRAEQLLQWQCNNFPLERFTNRLMGLDSMPFLEDFIHTTAYIKMKVMFWGKCQVANLRWRRYSINLASTMLSINFKW